LSIHAERLARLRKTEAPDRLRVNAANYRVVRHRLAIGDAIDYIYRGTC